MTVTAGTSALRSHVCDAIKSASEPHVGHGHGDMLHNY